MLADLPLSELRRYAPDVAEPADFDEFWSGQLAAVAEPGPAAFTEVSTALRPRPALTPPRGTCRWSRPA